MQYTNQLTEDDLKEAYNTVCQNLVGRSFARARPETRIKAVQLAGLLIISSLIETATALEKMRGAK